MMKRSFLTLFFFFNLLILAWSQSNTLLDFNQTRLQKQKTGMLVLGSWAIGNMALSAALLNGKQGENKAFHQMQIGWNVINLGIAAAGYIGVMRSNPGSLDLYHSIQDQYKMEKILLFNAGLDVGYMLGGAYLLERGKRDNVKNPAQLRGFGRSILLQGAFLFVFDLSLTAIISSDNPKIAPLLSRTQVRFDGQQLGVCANF
jgi:hypothetical protein